MFKYSLDKLYLIALSGGPDSMALLTMLKEQHYSLVVCFVNYHHRTNALQEQLMVENYVNSLGYPLEIEHCYYHKKDGNFENWAREQRYSFFYRMMKKYHAEACFVGHHQDDLLETYLLQKKRGYVSYYGLKEEVMIKKVKIIRPLLNYSKKELLEYCQNNHIPYSYDYTNEDISLKRNFIRHKVLLDYSPDEKIKLLEEIKNNNEKLININKKIDRLISNELNVEVFNTLSIEEQDRLLFCFINRFVEIPLSKNRLKEIRQKLLTKEGNVIFSLNESYQIIREYRSLNVVKKESYNYSIIVEAPCVIENDYIKMDLATNPQKFFIKEDSYPLTIKNVEKDKKVKIGKIHKSINRILIDEKIPYLKRLYWPMIVNNKGEIIFIPRKEVDEDGLFVVKMQKNMI